MATDVDVQYFSHLNGLTLGNNWGDLIRLLDKALVTGIDFTQITTASIDAQGDVHITLYAAHNAMLLQVVELSGFAPASLNQKYRIKGVPSATELILKPHTAITETSIVTIGSGKLASLGYEIIFRDANDVKRVYRAKNPTSQHPFIRVDETISDGTNTYISSYAKSAMVGLLESMEHIDDYENPGVLQLPIDTSNLKKNWSLSGSGTSNYRGWSKWYYACSQSMPNGPFDYNTPPSGNRNFTLLGDADAFYFTRSLTPGNHQNKLLSGCGLFNSVLDGSTVPPWFLMTTLKVTEAGSTSGGFVAVTGGTPLTFDAEMAKFLTTNYNIINKVVNHTIATSIIPDLLTGRSGIYGATSVAALELPFFDSQTRLRGNLKHIYYSGNNRGNVTQTTPLLSENSMYIIDAIWANPDAGSVYFYLGEFE
ncbi:hypothetical protein CAP42_05990 [Acinetobacter indicus]|uniref:hypothetical protein n=1 Tax=Acinetobacter indicus TaxID=756892 RepID=UPI000B3ED17B|nr:hypothetical protein [Acinetobacter indicus]OUY10550.1 hypothetical protein CAP42_05990 [Acinetobacter indicus]